MEFLYPPLLRRAFPTTIKPKHIDWAIVGQQLPYLRKHKLGITVPLLWGGLAILAKAIRFIRFRKGWVVGMVPINERKVQSLAQPSRSHRLHKLPDHVLFVMGVLHRERRRLGVEQGKAVVMLRGQHHVLHP